MDKMYISRDVTKKECEWLKKTVKKGIIVYAYSGCTYGCIGSGIAVTLMPNETPFFEIPRDALTPIEPVDKCNCEEWENGKCILNMTPDTCDIEHKFPKGKAPEQVEKCSNCKFGVGSDACMECFDMCNFIPKPPESKQDKIHKGHLKFAKTDIREQESKPVNCYGLWNSESVTCYNCIYNTGCKKQSTKSSH